MLARISYMRETDFHRLDRLEATLSALVERLETQYGVMREATPASLDRRRSPQPEDAPPVFMIREVANEMGLPSPGDVESDDDNTLLTRASLSAPTVHEMLTLYSFAYQCYICIRQD